MSEYTDSILIPFGATADCLDLLYNESIQELADIYYREHISPWLKKVNGRLSNVGGVWVINIDTYVCYREDDSIFLTDEGVIAFKILSREVLGTSSPLGCFMKEG